MLEEVLFMFFVYVFDDCVDVCSVLLLVVEVKCMGGSVELYIYLSGGYGYGF